MKKAAAILTAAFLLLSLPAFAAKEKQKKPTYKEKLEARVHTLVNKEREKHGLKPFKLSKKLSAIALAHSKDMAKRNYTAHVTPEGLGPSDRAKKAGYKIRKKMGNRTRIGVGENLFEGANYMTENGVKKPYLEKYDILAEKIVNGWMNSPPHRRNILDATYTLVGYGIAISKDKVVRVTQMFF